MISSGVLTIFYYFILLVGSPLTLFPDVSLPAGVASAISSASSYAHILDVVLPVSTLITFIGFYLGIEVAIFTYKIIKWIYQKIPGIN